jgi:hypothetical protein
MMTSAHGSGRTSAVVAALALSTAVAILASPLRAAADEGDAARIGAQALFIGQQAMLVIDVAAPARASVELDPAAASWSGVEVVRLGKTEIVESEGRTIHRIEVTVAAFQPGSIQFAPAVTVIVDGAVATRQLPAVAVTVAATLAAGAPLELSPLAGPAAITGAESPLLRPAIAAGSVVAALLLAALGVVAVRWALRRPPHVRAPEAALVAVPDFSDAAELLQRDPVSAYRTLAMRVKHEIGERYGFAAAALTTGELQRRMEGHGVERWQARLVGGLLEECDAVIYAGYRPAQERRLADLNMAREIVEGRA